MELEFESAAEDSAVEAVSFLDDTMKDYEKSVAYQVDSDPSVLAAITMATKSQTFEIVDKMSAENAAACLAILKRGIKAVEDHAARFVSPARLHVDALRKAVASRSAPLKDAFGQLNGRLIDWRNAEEVLADETREEARKAAQAVVDKANEGKPIEDQAPAVEVYIPRPPTTFATPQGQTVVRRPWKFEITDPSIVPDEYHVRMIDEKKIRAAVQAGTRHIPGVRIYRGNETAIRLGGGIE